jgi:exodeoxyribonuclease VII large subunit
VTLARERLEAVSERLVRAGLRNLEVRRERFERLDAERRMTAAFQTRTREVRQQLDSLGRLLDGYSYHKTLERGFAVVRSDDSVVTRKSQITGGQLLDIEFADGRTPAVAGKSKGRADGKSPKKGGGQGSLL